MIKLSEMQRHADGKLISHHVISPSLLTLLYVEQGMIACQIAKQLGCSVQTVYWYLRKYNIPRRPRPCGALFAGHRHTDDTRQKISGSLKGRISPNKGNVYSEASRQRLREAAERGRWGDRLPHLRGSSHWNWKGGIHQWNQREREQVRVKKWRLAIFRRDRFRCQVCEYVGGRLNAHHIELWSTHPSLRFNLDNGVTLCVECHKLVHSKTKRGLR